MKGVRTRPELSSPIGKIIAFECGTRSCARTNCPSLRVHTVSKAFQGCVVQGGVRKSVTWTKPEVTNLAQGQRADRRGVYERQILRLCRRAMGSESRSLSLSRHLFGAGSYFLLPDHLCGSQDVSRLHWASRAF